MKKSRLKTPYIKFHQSIKILEPVQVHLTLRTNTSGCTSAHSLTVLGYIVQVGGREGRQRRVFCMAESVSCLSAIRTQNNVIDVIFFVGCTDVLKKKAKGCKTSAAHCSAEIVRRL